MISLPLYRAKRLDSDEYVEGLYDYSKDVFYSGKIEESHYIKVQKENGVAIISYSEKIDPTTLSIHFSDMLDNQGNKIFASLSEDGKGGDITNKGICVYESKYNQFRIITNLKTRTWLEITREDLDSYPIKVIGIQND